MAGAPQAAEAQASACQDALRGLAEERDQLQANVALLSTTLSELRAERAHADHYKQVRLDSCQHAVHLHCSPPVRYSKSPACNLLARGTHVSSVGYSVDCSGLDPLPFLFFWPWEWGILGMSALSGLHHTQRTWMKGHGDECAWALSCRNARSSGVPPIGG